jgi:hypothetical protein
VKPILSLALLSLVGPAFAGSTLSYSLPATSVLSLSPEARQPVPEPTFTPLIGYAWSLSGDHFAESRVTLEFLVPRLSLDAVLAVRLRDNAPAPGLGASYRFERERWNFAATVSALMPQNDRFDFTAGFSVGVRF